MNVVKFISVQYLKDNTAIQDNVEDKLLNPYILKAHDTHIQQILGTNYYNHLKDGVTSGSLSTNELNLMRTYIQPCVSEWAFYEVIPHMNFKATNKAISQQTSEFSAPSALNDIKYLRSSVRDMAEFYSKRLTKELCNNLSLYPEYGSQGTNNLDKRSTRYFNGLYINRKGPKGMDVYDDPTNCC